MKILIADGDSDLVDMVTYALVRRGHHAVAAYDGMHALQRALTEGLDLVLLSADLPQLAGSDVCRRIREQSPVAIIMLGADTDEAGLISAYECGADDYIVKPFSVRLLSLRIDALMRRVTGVQTLPHDHGGSRIDIGDLVIDPAAFEVRKNRVSIPLTRLEFRILYCLARHAGMLVETPRLAHYTWKSDVGGDATLLKTHVSHIRQKLADAGGDAVAIRAVPRTGYILTCRVQETREADGLAVSAG